MWPWILDMAGAIDHPTQDNWVMMDGDELTLAIG